MTGNRQVCIVPAWDDTKTASDARQRLLDTADRLFYAEGFRAVGIDRIIAEAGVAKMTLYSHFRSKDDLILAVLRHREEQVLAWFAREMERHTRSGRGPARGRFFAALKEWFESPGFRGCAFINASVELADAGHPGSVFARQHKERFHELPGEAHRGVAGRVGGEARPGRRPADRGGDRHRRDPGLVRPRRGRP